ncbi:carboxymuconolactone decarboxylase family protein [Candidatus Omnitrophota bacterium]
MQRINPIKSQEATGKAKELLGAVEKSMGMAPNILKTMANSPSALEAFLNISGALSSGVLSAKIREQIALLTATINKCDYCLAAHTFIAKNQGISEAAIDEGKNGASSDSKTDAILKFVRAVVQKKAVVDDSEIAALRDAGVSDEEIVEIIANVVQSIFTNYFNHIVKTDIDFPR